MQKILITAAGGGGTNRLIDTLNDRNYSFIGTNINKFKAACSIADKTYLVPRALEEENYISTINKICEIEKPDLFIPNSDIEVEIVSKHKDKIKVKTFLPSYNVIKLFQDKYLSYEFCRDNNINTAKTINLSSIDDINTIDKYFDNFPLWCRIKSGSGSKFTSMIYSKTHANNFISYVLEANDIDISEFLISEVLPGNDYAVMTIWKNGELVFCKMAHRMYYFNKQGQSPPYVIKTFFDKKILEFVTEATLKLDKNMNGLLNFDLKVDSNNKVALTEINTGRFYYNMPLFNTTDNINGFQYFLKTAFNEIKNYPVFGKEEKYFIREMDNCPYVFTKEEIEQRVITL